MADGALVDARKGSANYHLAIRGRAAHVGRAFNDGRNAVIAAADAAMALNQLNGKRDGVTFNVGAIDGGGAVNVVPERAVLRFNVRVPDEESGAWARSRSAAHRRRRQRARRHRSASARRLHPPAQAAQRRSSAPWRPGRIAPAKRSASICNSARPAASAKATTSPPPAAPTSTRSAPAAAACTAIKSSRIIPSFAERAKLSFLMLAGVERGLFDPKSLRP